MSDHATIVPRVAFVINLAHSDEARLAPANTKQLLRAFREHRLPATWAVADALQAAIVEGPHEIALAVDRHWAAAPQTTARFAEELRGRLAGLQAQTSLVLGDPTPLGSRLAVLAEHGIRAVFTTSAAADAPVKPRPLPCGMWLLGPRIRLPKRRFARWLPTRPMTVSNLVAAARDGNVLVSVSAVEMERAGRRAMNALDKLLRDVRREELRVATVSEIIADLTARHAAKPQRSILRAA